MPWANGHYSVNHPRQPWLGSTHEHVIVHGRTDVLMRGFEPVDTNTKLSKKYLRAKTEFNLEDAFDIVEALVDSAAIDLIIDELFKFNGRHLIAFPHPSFDDEMPDIDPHHQEMPRNALPFAYAKFLSDTLGIERARGIVQSARVGRTKLRRFERFLIQPSFHGTVEAGARYLVIDDVVTTCGTIATLRSYIVDHGGTVALASALAHRDGCNVRFPVADSTLRMLYSIYGKELEAFWKETIGHEVFCLTEAEAGTLLDWATEQKAQRPRWEPLHGLRAALDRAAAT